MAALGLHLHRNSGRVSRRSVWWLLAADAIGSAAAGHAAIIAPSFPPAFRFDWGRAGCSRLQRPYVAIGATRMQIGATSLALLGLGRPGRNKIEVKLGASGARAHIETLSVDQAGTRLSRKVGGKVTLLYRCEA